MKRSRLCAALVCGALGAALVTTPALATALNDLRHHWAQAQVYTLMEHGMIAGYPDHTFRPDNPITREEAAVLIHGLLEARGISLEDAQSPSDETENPPSQDIPSQDIPSQDIPSQDNPSQDIPSQDVPSQEKPSQDTPSQEKPSQDIPSQDIPDPAPEDGKEPQAKDPADSAASHAEAEPAADGEQPSEPEPAPLPTYTDLDACWAKDYIDSLQVNGLLPQDGSTLFHPLQNLTRGEAAQILYACVAQWPDSFSLAASNETPAIYDMAGRAEEEAVLTLARMGVLSGRGDGTYCPDDPITRAEFSVMLLNLSGYATMTEVEFDPLPVCTVIPTPYISQVYPAGAWVGCEPTSLLMGLKAKGYALDVSLDQFLADLPKTESNPAKGFVGSPYVPSETLRTTIYPAPLAEYGQRYGNVKDFSGKSVEELREEVLLGNPVVIYVTLYWKNPYYRDFNIEGTTQRLLRNNHAVLVCGYDASTEYYYIADPYNIDNRYHDYFYWISADVLDPLYMVRQHAVAVE